MADTRLRFVRFIKGKYARFRHPLVGDVLLPGKPGDPAFHQAYAQYLDMVERRKQVKKEKKGTFEWLIEQYQRSAEFACLADPTQIDYNRTLAILVAELGEQPFKLTTRKMIKDVRDNFAHQPRKAHKIKQMVSRLYSWADENELVEEGFNPAGKLKKLKSKGGVKEYVVWSDQEIAWFLSAAPAHVRTPALIALYTGQRREDVASMVWNQFQGDIIRVRQSKTTALLDIACHPVLRPHLDDVKRSRKVVSLTGEADLVCRTTDGSAFTPNGLSMAIRRVVEKIPEMPNNRNIHGLRYAAGSRMDEAGCSVSEIEAVLGHRTFKMALKYAPQRLRRRARSASWRRKDEPNSPPQQQRTKHEAGNRKGFKWKLALDLRPKSEDFRGLGPMAEWLRRGLQILARRFDSGSGLHPLIKSASADFGQAYTCRLAPPLQRTMLGVHELSIYIPSPR